MTGLSVRACTLLFLAACAAPAASRTTVTPSSSAAASSAARVTTPARPTPPTRDPRTPGYVQATELPDGAVPSAEADGNFIIGATHDTAPEMRVRADVPRGVVHTFTMSSADSRLYPGIARDSGTFGRPDVYALPSSAGSSSSSFSMPCRPPASIAASAR